MIANWKAESEGTDGSSYWQNQDAVFKDAATLFKGKTLDFLGLDLGQI